ncbi:uncharacterized protein LOC117155282 [Bombus vancouverensis nearcticus]|uniref:uncharacterized protein LOC117155282 n=1 Tax=Bombus vancouverensis nearcticus TaxID=2705178 RepID=UPI001438CB6C|nr:uncharacterized protein LOC117155282 [Bombus vancouverensis nearcticus]
MGSNTPKVRFALGSEVSSNHFKSNFARSFVTNCRASKSLDYELLNNTTNEDDTQTNGNNNNFTSLLNFGSDITTVVDNNACKDSPNLWKTNEPVQSSADISELKTLKAQYRSLIEENRRLQEVLASTQIPHVQVVDNVFLQTQIETLQWQLKQMEANRQMYRALMEQVLRFLDRARKSLDILHEKNNPKDKKSTGRFPRSYSVHTVHADSPSNHVSLAPSSSTSSRFMKSKSVTQISPCTTNYREFTWSMLRRNDPAHCTSPLNKSQGLNKTHDGVVYKSPTPPKLDPNDIPPQKLSQEAFRLMRTVQSLLLMREPDLTRISSIENNGSSPSPIEDHRYNNHHNEVSVTLQDGSYVNPTCLQGAIGYSSYDHGTESSSTDNDSRSFVKTSSNIVEVSQSLRDLLPGIRRSVDTTSLNSGSSKTTEEEDLLPNNNCLNVSISNHKHIYVCTPTSTPNRRVRKVEKKEKPPKSKPTDSVSSVEDESGFSSMSSFQEIGLPNILPISPIRGCHQEVGLPVVPLEKARHRRWSSTPAEIRAFFNKHRSSFTASRTTTESLSVWV